MNRKARREHQRKFNQRNANQSEVSRELRIQVRDILNSGDYWLEMLLDMFGLESCCKDCGGVLLKEDTKAYKRGN